MEDDKVRCPKCSSAQIHAEKRGWNVFVGMLGSSKIVLTCLKCAHEFRPGGKPAEQVDPMASSPRWNRINRW